MRSDRANEGRPQLAAFNYELDQIEMRGARLAAERIEIDVPEGDVIERLAGLQEKFSPQSVEIVMNVLLHNARNKDDTAR